MSVTRREFMRSVGVTMVSLAGARHLGGCRSSPPAASAQDSRVPPGPEGGAHAAARRPEEAGATAAAASGWERVRASWFGLQEWKESTEYIEDEAAGERERDRRQDEHRAALDALVAGARVRPPVADLIVVAFDEAAFHVWRNAVMATCYDPTSLGWRLQQTRDQLLERLELLEKMVRDGDIDADAVALSRTALERQIAVFDAADEIGRQSGEARWEAEGRLVDLIEAGGLEPDADEAEAARILVDVLLGRQPSPPTPADGG